MNQASTSAAPAAPEQDENKLVAERRDKLKALRAAQAAGGAVAFPNDFAKRPRSRLAPSARRY
jgi:lysyl-tRNA synthetase class 2